MNNFSISARTIGFAVFVAIMAQPFFSLYGAVSALSSVAASASSNPSIFERNRQI